MKKEPVRQRLAVPAYFPPGLLWKQLDAAAGAVGLAVVNPASGPGMDLSPDYAAQIAASRANGIAIIGYVDTDYAARPLVEVRQDIERYAAWYGVDGIFLDQVSADCSCLPYYAEASGIVKQGDATALTVLNPGTRPPEGLIAAADIVVTFEGSWDTYISGYSAAPWMRRYAPERFCHLIHGVPAEGSLRRALRLSAMRRAGWVYMTDGALPNPWATLPSEPYWRAEELLAAS